MCRRGRPAASVPLQRGIIVPESWIIVGLMACHGAIAWWNAKVCGQSWAESKAFGGFIRAAVWSAAIQSALGFSAVLIAPLILLTHAIAPNAFPEPAMQAAIHLWYLTVILPVLGTGLIVTVQSWVLAWRERRIADMGLAAYNSLALSHNTYGAVIGIADSLSKVTDLVKDAFGSDDDNPAAAIALALTLLVVATALLGGALMTAALIQHYAGTLPLPARHQAGQWRAGAIVSG